MAKNKKTVAAHPASVPSDLLSMLTGWMQQGVEGFSATQRMFEEVAVRQNAATTKALQEGIASAEFSPSAIMKKLAVEGTSSFMEAQKILLNLAQQENEIVMNGVKERVAGSTRATAVTDMVRRSLDTFVRMQQDFLKTTSKQVSTWLDTVSLETALQGAPLIDLAREEMDAFVHAQQNFLDVILQEAAKAATGTGARPKKRKKTDLSKLAQNATNSFVEAQKRLLEVLTEQMAVNVNVATRVMRLMSPQRLIPMASLTGEGLRALVGAEKTLIDAMTKPEHQTGPQRRQVRRHKVRAAHAAA